MILAVIYINTFGIIVNILPDKYTYCFWICKKNDDYIMRKKRLRRWLLQPI